MRNMPQSAPRTFPIPEGVSTMLTTLSPRSSPRNGHSHSRASSAPKRHPLQDLGEIVAKRRQSSGQEQPPIVEPPPVADPMPLVAPPPVENKVTKHKQPAPPQTNPDTQQAAPVAPQTVPVAPQSIPLAPQSVPVPPQAVSPPQTVSAPTPITPQAQQARPATAVDSQATISAIDFVETKPSVAPKNSAPKAPKSEVVIPPTAAPLPAANPLDELANIARARLAPAAQPVIPPTPVQPMDSKEIEPKAKEVVAAPSPQNVVPQQTPPSNPVPASTPKPATGALTETPQKPVATSNKNFVQKPQKRLISNRPLPVAAAAPRTHLPRSRDRELIAKGFLFGVGFWLAFAGFQMVIMGVVLLGIYGGAHASTAPVSNPAVTALPASR